MRTLAYALVLSAAVVFGAAIATAAPTKIPIHGWRYIVTRADGSVTMAYSGAADFPGKLHGESHVKFSLVATSLLPDVFFSAFGGSAIDSLSVTAQGNSSWDPPSVHNSDCANRNGTDVLKPQTSVEKGGMRFRVDKQNVHVSWFLLPFAEAGNTCFAPLGIGSSLESEGKMSRTYPLSSFDHDLVTLRLQGSEPFDNLPHQVNETKGTYKWDATVVLRRVKANAGR